MNPDRLRSGHLGTGQTQEKTPDHSESDKIRWRHGGERGREKLGGSENFALSLGERSFATKFGFSFMGAKFLSPSIIVKLTLSRSL
jgi:hypothetical protein